MSVGFGAMRLSTDADRDDARARATIEAALAGGVDLIDTADAYALDADDAGHNERLIAAVVGARTVEIVTKGGLVRPGGAWVPDGRARHLREAARASRERLGRPPDLYLLHAVDPGTTFATSVRALARIREAGDARAVGLSNVNATQLEAALAITEIAAVEVELHPGKLDAIRGGLVRACEARGIRVLAHRPLGGPAGVARLRRDATLAAIAARLGATPEEVALAWLRSLSSSIVTLPGATRPETAASIGRAATLALDDGDRAAIAERYLAVGTRAAVATVDDGREVVMIAGMPASGKSTLAEDYVARGYARLNRDERGGSLLDLARALDGELAGGTPRVVIDNTYGTRAQRAAVIEVARGHGVAIRCIEVATPLEQAQANAVARILGRHGRLLEVHEHAGEILPRVQFRWQREHEPATVDEGFSGVEKVVPARVTAGTRRALIVELDGVLARGRPRTPEAVAIDPAVAEAIAAWSAHAVAVTAWRPEWVTGSAEARVDRALSRIVIDPSTDQPAADGSVHRRVRARIEEVLGRSIALLACGHGAGPPACWCRKPLPGLALAFARSHDVDLARSVHVGKGPMDRGFAARAGCAYADVASGWPAP